MRGTELLISSSCVGMQPNIAFDLAILNDGAIKLGYLSSDYLSPVVINDTITLQGAECGQMSMPVELYLTADGKKTMLVLRGGATDMRAFANAFKDWISETGFSGVALLSAAWSPVKRERDSNLEIPKLFAYCNKHLESQGFYEKQGIRKFGWWFEEKHKTKYCHELRDMVQAGWAPRLFKTLCKLDMPVGIFLVFCQGGVDFIGGYTMYKFIQKPFFNTNAGLKEIGSVDLGSLKSGEEVHEHIFQSGAMKYPFGWAQILAYF